MPAAPDLTGKRFGKLICQSSTRNSRGKLKWTCLCDCGQTVTREPYCLRKGTCTHCGCQTKQDLVGKKFGRLTVVKYLGKHSKFKWTKWECLCSCGKTTEVWSRNLKRRKESCGCNDGHKNKKVPSFQRYVKAKLGIAKVNSNKAGREFELTYEQGAELLLKPCHYCGTTEKIGIDRKDSKIGYILSNCLPCCTMCNYMKTATNYDEFLNKISQIYNHVIST